MLPAAHRLRRGEDFRTCTRHGRSAGRPLLVVHLMQTQRDEPAKVGFVVSRSVGAAVERARVKRRLRHLCAPRLSEFAPGTLVVVRARKDAATAPSSDLARDLGEALRRLSNTPISGRAPAADLGRRTSGMRTPGMRTPGARRPG